MGPRKSDGDGDERRLPWRRETDRPPWRDGDDSTGATRSLHRAVAALAGEADARGQSGDGDNLGAETR
ncbi:hypothetical protein E2562_029186 [Oryza meyeriana var. granulata]|uniref:Uncharacterized protein n=1 Tax=Oryza meyeriana var. granulata TaxID=110450 RepID=A0A6G1C151_9ORYZ|nr:hypothetical protein E2562_029186 [Oryza meyeriana var. granulata]